MSINLVKSYFKNIGIKRGLKEHKNPFNILDIPGSNYDKTFHIEALKYSVVKQNQIDLDMECEVTVRIFIKGFNQVYENEEKCKTECENYFTECLKVENRLNQPNYIKNVRLIGFFVEPFDQSNDNWIVGKMDFSMKFIKIIEMEA